MNEESDLKIPVYHIIDKKEQIEYVVIGWEEHGTHEPIYMKRKICYPIIKDKDGKRN